VPGYIVKLKRKKILQKKSNYHLSKKKVTNGIFLMFNNGNIKLIYLFADLRIKCKALHTQGKYSTTGL
jgi:hypothetical protein